MTTLNFIPTIWNSQMLLDFNESAIAANLVNREYEGDARKGNTVRVTTAAPIEIKNYKTGAVDNGAGGTIPRTTTPDGVTDTKTDLLIDQEKNFDFLVDDIDRAQAAGSMDAYTTSAGQGLAEDSDQFLFATAVTNAGTVLPAGDGAGTPAAIDTPEAAYNVIKAAAKALDQKSAPKLNRVAVMNAEFLYLLLDYSSKFVTVDTSGYSAALRGASIGRVLNFDMFTSENLPGGSDGTKAQFVGWYKPSLAYVSQIEETEGMRAQNSFSDRLRGLHVYGAKVVRPKGVVSWTNL